MPYLTGQILLNGAILDLVLAVSSPRAQALRVAGQPVPQSVSLRGLIDLGADSTFVDTQHLPFLNLEVPQTVLVGDGRGGFTYAPQYPVCLTIVNPSGIRRDNQVLGAHPVVDRMLDPALGYEVLIGRDVLDGCLFVYNGRAGTFVLAY
jgi:hypothetical protein